MLLLMFSVNDLKYFYIYIFFTLYRRILHVFLCSAICVLYIHYTILLQWYYIFLIHVCFMCTLLSPHNFEFGVFF